MAAVLLIVSLLAAAAMVVGVVLARRLQQARDTLASVDKAVGGDTSGGSVQERARDLRLRAADAESASADYVAALEGASTGIAILSTAGVVNFANPTAEALLEGPGERAVLRSRVTALGQRVHRSGLAETVEVSAHDPERRVLGLTAIPLPSEEGTGAVCLYMEDLSARRRIDAMRSDFVANASHELKTPLGALALLAETLADAKDEETRVRLSSRLQAEASRMARVINDVLQLAETESLGAEYSNVSMRDVIEEAVKSVEPLAQDRGIALENGPIVDATVSADREQLMSALRNLLRNAVTYTYAKEDGGVVRYRSFLVEESVCIEVEDTGIGIPDRYRERVFERFFRVDRARSRESGGTGLGLSIVRNVAIAHGGSVDLRSQVGVGSTFTMCIPTIQKEQP